MLLTLFCLSIRKTKQYLFIKKSMTFYEIPSFSITLGTTSSEEDFEKSNVTDFCAHIVIGNNSIRHNTTNFLVIVIRFYNFVNQVCSRLCLYLIKKKIGIVDYSLSI